MGSVHLGRFFFAGASAGFWARPLFMRLRLGEVSASAWAEAGKGAQQPTPVASTMSVPARLQRRCGCPCVRLRLGEVSASARAEAGKRYATAHSSRIDHVGAGAAAAAMWLSMHEAAPGQSQRLRLGGGGRGGRNSPLRPLRPGRCRRGCSGDVVVHA